MGVFPSKSDKSPLKPGHPHINKQGFINPGSTVQSLQHFKWAWVWKTKNRHLKKAAACIHDGRR